jgi:hypothetical protein
LEDDRGTYTLDVAERDFHALRDVSPNQLVELAHRYLSDVPMLPLDPRQQESWGRWGNNGERGVGPGPRLTVTCKGGGQSSASPR